MFRPQALAARVLAGAFGLALLASVAAQTAMSPLPGAPAIRVLAMAGRTPQLAAQADPTAARFRPDARLSALGRRLFNEPGLSNPAGTSCASCHDPARAFSPTLPQAALSGSRTPPGSRAGRFSARNAPSLLYVRYVPRRYFYEDDDAQVPAPFGGLFSDGRADTLEEQVRGPLFDPDEMNNGSPPALLRRLAGGAAGEALAAAFGPEVVRDPQRMLDAVARSLAAYLRSDEMAPFSSHFDEFLRGTATLSAAELRGLALFKNPEKGNCVACHKVNDTARRPERSLFTDFGYEALGVPRNAKLAANATPGRFDTGLDSTARRLGWPRPAQWCGFFRTPSLRNVAVRQAFMHNASLHTLREAVSFYATRSTDPAHWYSDARFDDVPRPCRGNINTTTMPLNRRAGARPALSAAEVGDIVAFLRTLTDARYASAMPHGTPALLP